VRRIVLAEPDVSISVPIAISILVGAIAGTGACVWFLAGLSSLCQIFPVVSVSAALFAPAPWAFRHRIPSARRATFVFLVFALFAAAMVIVCR
jgi:hypothetical protein